MLTGLCGASLLHFCLLFTHTDTSPHCSAGPQTTGCVRLQTAHAVCLRPHLTYQRGYHIMLSSLSAFSFFSLFFSSFFLSHSLSLFLTHADLHWDCRCLGCGWPYFQELETVSSLEKKRMLDADISRGIMFLGCSFICLSVFLSNIHI